MGMSPLPARIVFSRESEFGERVARRVARSLSSEGVSAPGEGLL